MRAKVGALGMRVVHKAMRVTGVSEGSVLPWGIRIVWRGAGSLLRGKK